jgi:hypothetical protein
MLHNCMQCLDECCAYKITGGTSTSCCSVRAHLCKRTSTRMKPPYHVPKRGHKVIVVGNRIQIRKHVHMRRQCEHKHRRAHLLDRARCSFCLLSMGQRLCCRHCAHEGPNGYCCSSKWVQIPRNMREPWRYKDLDRHRKETTQSCVLVFAYLTLCSARHAHHKCIFRELYMWPILALECKAPCSCMVGRDCSPKLPSIMDPYMISATRKHVLFSHDIFAHSAHVNVCIPTRI